MEQTLNEFITSIVVFLASNYPIAFAIVSVIGVLRLIFKPIFALARNVVSATESKKDDEVLDKVEESKAFKIIAFIIDLIGSIKIEKKPVKK